MGLFSGLGNLLFGENPANKANDYLEKIPGMIKPYYDPFIQQGKGAFDTLNPTTQQMTTDPVKYLENIMQMYEPSKSYDFMKDKITKAAGNTAAAGGYRGTYADASNQSELVNGLLSQDMQKWLENVLGIQKTGMGQQQNFYDKGFDASKSFAGDLANVTGTQATNASQGQAQDNQNRQAILKLIGQSIGGLGGWL